MTYQIDHKVDLRSCEEYCSSLFFLSLSFILLFSVSVDKTEIDLFMRRQIEMNHVKLSDLCKVERIDEDSDIPTLCPRPIGFERNVKMTDVISEFDRCCSSTTFIDMWLQKCREVGDNCKTFDDVLTQIWKEIKER